MASPRPKSPGTPASRNNSKDESIWEKIGTLGRKKKIQQVQNVSREGKFAIDSPGGAVLRDLPAEYYNIEEGEERSMIDPHSYNSARFADLRRVLTGWLNDELAQYRIIVKSLEEDLYDGHVLQKLTEKLSGVTLAVPEVTQSEVAQKQKLKVVIGSINQMLGLGHQGSQLWNVEKIHSKNVIAIVHLLVALVRHYRAPIRLPENVFAKVVIVKKEDGQLSHRLVEEEMTSTYDDLGLRYERDAFDTLFDHAPDKLQVVKKSLVTFANKQLNKINLEVTDLDSQFNDGVYLCLMMGLLEDYFVPLYDFHLTPRTFEDKVHNVSFAFELMQDAGLPPPKPRPEDIVNLDLKSTLRVLYNLFFKYKHLN
ncbi:Beta-parvin [Amphibalanus amphitrite]|uniref:Beta-parvin n=1 Tax=Amphibalanus amphitrite TaxID=1232801 RepID=A0A6A4V0I3_AMPAM|nr:beta-parvin-like [Amphibalanus amphitrite]XP_043230658.1 beta-parvin-like [Amphibalanus amphitrite]KAF0287145.1 Beta-parvin [Amphibalanus amphitrite]